MPTIPVFCLRIIICQNKKKIVIRSIVIIHHDFQSRS